MRTNEICIYKHPDQKYLIPVIHIIYEKVGSARYLTFDFNFLAYTSYLTIKLK